MCLAAEISQLKGSLAHLDAVIKMFDGEKLQLLNDLCNIVQNLMDRKFGVHQWGTLSERPIKAPPRTSSNRKNK